MRVTGAAKEMAGMSSKTQDKHDNLISFVSKGEDRDFDRLLTQRRFADPYKDESAELYILVNKVEMPETVKNELCQQSEIGRMLYEAFGKDRIHSNKVSLWSLMKKRKLLTWKGSGKVLRVSCKYRVIGLQEDRALFA